MLWGPPQPFHSQYPQPSGFQGNLWGIRSCMLFLGMSGAVSVVSPAPEAPAASTIPLVSPNSTTKMAITSITPWNWSRALTFWLILSTTTLASFFFPLPPFLGSSCSWPRDAEVHMIVRSPPRAWDESGDSFGSLFILNNAGLEPFTNILQVERWMGDSAAVNCIAVFETSYEPKWAPARKLTKATTKRKATALRRGMVVTPFLSPCFELKDQ
mmetsp:Transcript_48829/g.87006  ORF Transcript_48829/g.87006 Transcript_48829/m.87006 type:complete len:213 (+) Transcript_48829:469-1107(+)